MPPSRDLGFVSRILLFLALGLGLASHSSGKPSSEARLTHLANDVQLVSGNGSEGVLHQEPQARPATLNESVNEYTLVRTGADSRAELSFPNETVVRLAANTVFHFEHDTRGLKLNEGAMLIDASRKAKRARVIAGAVTADIAGTTSMIEHHSRVFKFLVLQGTGRVFRAGHLGDSVVVGPGQIVIGKTSAPLSNPADFDIARFVRTSRLITDFLPLQSKTAIVGASEKQQRRKSRKTLIDTNLVIFGSGTAVSLTKENNSSRPSLEQPTSTNELENLGPID
jgi:mannose-6-phosphate isomerase-like protein (cupin superfamily)